MPQLSPQSSSDNLTLVRNGALVRRFYGFFFVSGFCSILYELIWLRLAMAQFGVTTTLVATFLAEFMDGMVLGSWTESHFVRHAQFL